MKTIITLALCIVASSHTMAQNTIDQIMYKAYLSNQPESGALWKKAVTERQLELNASNGNTEATYNLVLAQFGLMSSTMKNKDEETFDEYYDVAIEHIETLKESNKKWAEPLALQSAIYGLKMGYSPMQGMFLGSKSNDLVEKAKKIDPSSALSWKVYANSKFFTPEMWGGDLKEAIKAYEKCIHLYEAKPAELVSNWLYLDALAFQGQAYLKNGERGKAIATYEKALRVEPDFLWVKNVLLPKAKSGV